MKSYRDIIKEASSNAEREAIYALRYKVYVEEMGKAYRHADHKNKLLYDSLDESATLLYASVGGRIIGTTRINWGRDPGTISAFTEPFSLHLFDNFPDEALSFCSRLMVDRAYRRSSLAAQLALASYIEGRKRKVQLNFSHCRPALVGFFERLGFRRYKREIIDPDAGPQLPMVLALEDLAHLEAVRSPFRREAGTYTDNAVQYSGPCDVIA